MKKSFLLAVVLFSTLSFKIFALPTGISTVQTAQEQNFVQTQEQTLVSADFMANDTFNDGIFEYSILQNNTAEIRAVLDKEAFSGCQIIPDTLNGYSISHIYSTAFNDCKNLTKVVIPKSVKSIDQGAFAGCDALEEIILPKYDFITRLFTFSTQTTSKYYAQIQKHQLNISGYPTPVYPELNREYMYGAYVPEGAFYYNNRTTWDYTEEVRGYMTYCKFYGYRIYSYYHVPKSVKTFIITDDETNNEKTSFHGIGLDFTAENKVETLKAVIENTVFYYSFLEDSTVEIIGCETAESIVSIPPTLNRNIVSKIGKLAFFDCDTVKEVLICKNIKEIESNAFLDCSSLSSITIPSCVSVIKECAFCNCTALKQAKITYSFTDIQGNAFNNCSNLTLHSHQGSNAQAYALENNLDFVKITDIENGDVSVDGVVNNRDAARILQFVADWGVEIDEEAADVTGDGKVNNRDAARILQYIAGWDVTLD